MEGDSKEITFFLWGLLEGLIFIHRRGYMDAGSVDLTKASEGGMQAIFRGIRK